MTQKTTFHRDIALVCGTEEPYSAELAVSADGKVKITKISGQDVSNQDTEQITSCVWLSVPNDKTFAIDFKLPNAGSAPSTFSYTDSNGRIVSGSLADAGNNIRRLNVTNTPDVHVTCVLNWDTDLKGAVTITVRPRSSTHPVYGSDAFSVDEPTVDTSAARIDRKAVHDLIDGGVLDAAECEAICADLWPLYEFILNDPRRGEAFWEAFQRHFGFAHAQERVTPMNAANLCPEPTLLLQAANRLRLQYNDNVAQQTRTRRGERVRQLEKVRELLATGLGLGDPNDVAMIRNSSEGNNAIGCGYRDWDLQANRLTRDNVVLWSENHPTNLESWRLRAQWSSRTPLFDIIEVSWPYDASEREILEAFTKRIDERTRFVSYTDTSNGSGFRVPDSVVRGIWEHVERNGYDCHIHIDGTMAWGVRPVNLARPHCHSFVSSAHKWFLGPKETAFLWMSPSKAPNFAPSIFAYDYRITVGAWQHMPRNALRFELIGQRDDVNLIVLGLTQMMWTALQPRDPYARIVELATELKRLLAESPDGPWELVTPHDPARSRGIVRVKAPRGQRAKNLYDWLYEHDTYRIGGSGDDETFRLCPHVYNTLADVRTAVAGMNEWRRLGR